MQQRTATGARSSSGPSFQLIVRQPLRPAVVLLAALVTAGGLSGVLYGLTHSKPGHRARGGSGGGSAAAGTAGAKGGTSTDDDEDDDPSQVDTIVLGDPADAPVPARKATRGGSSHVHATILARLPRFGEQVGLIPDSPAGHLLYRWLAAFNQSSEPAMEQILPSSAPNAAAAQMQLRQQTGGFNLVSAKEVEPGLLVFRLRDQTPEVAEALGTLQMRPNSNPPAIAIFSLGAVATAGSGAAGNR